MNAVKEIAASLSIPFSCEIVHHPVYPSVRSILAKTRRERPGARFTFDLSGGSKELCLALMSFAPWAGGGIFYAFNGKMPRSVPLPDRSVRNMMGNPNYQMILAVLLRKTKDRKGISDLPWLTRSYLFIQFWP